MNERLEADEGEHEELEEYGEPGIASADAKVPGWLKWTYVILPILGIFSWVYFINGSHGWLDRGYWEQLQRAANTTYPFIDQDYPEYDQDFSDRTTDKLKR